ncbi:hypothetical protein [Photobacterium damselae]|uniref:hypothetical protein n=1 Tax=Photobacterium damselae TaxID=38293 RepID=UPI001F194598|nr:hypothetical protein [Photobacterium damselae]UKA04713.1 hypothetical protein IHC89_20960 [Photobacterium damselae subsp. damselae]
MFKIESLIKLAINGAGLPERVFLAKTGKSAVDINYLVTPNLLIPIIISITNIKHHQMFSDVLIHVENGIIIDNDVLSGMKITGDLNLRETSYPLGFILVSLTSTIVSLKNTIENGMVSDFISEWKSNAVALGKDGDVLQIDQYKKFKIPRH